MATSKKLIDLDGLGKVSLKKHKQARYIKIRVEEKGTVSVTMPYYVRYESAVDFLKSKIDWVQGERKKFAKISLPITTFKTKFRELELIRCEVVKPGFRLSPTKIKVYYPEILTVAQSSLRFDGLPQDDNQNQYCHPEEGEARRKDLSAHDVQKIIHQAIEKALRLEAKVYLPKRLAELAAKHNLKYKKLRIKNTKTRWGSCSRENNINLCSHLMKLPDELIDYVILHELAHTIEKNHSEDFWSLLSNLLGANAKIIDKKLKAYKTSL